MPNLCEFCMLLLVLYIPYWYLLIPYRYVTGATMDILLWEKFIMEIILIIILAIILQE